MPLSSFSCHITFNRWCCLSTICLALCRRVDDRGQCFQDLNNNLENARNHISIKIPHENTFTEWVWCPSIFRASSPTTIGWGKAFSALVWCITIHPSTFKPFFQIRVIWILTSDHWIKKHNCVSVGIYSSSWLFSQIILCDIYIVLNIDFWALT